MEQQARETSQKFHCKQRPKSASMVKMRACNRLAMLMWTLENYSDKK